MSYIFQTGRLPNLSYAELLLLLSSEIYTSYPIKRRLNLIKNDIRFISENFIILQKEFDIQILQDIFKRSGSFIRFLKVIDDKDLINNESKRLTVGVSSFTSEIDPKHILKEIKGYCKKEGINVRYILPKNDNVLNAAQVIKNDLLKEDSYEIVIFKDLNGKILFTKTINIQDIDSFSERDINRPYIDKDLGVLPTKLARILVNLSSNEKEDKNLWDPFCGSGTILTEAMFLGYDVIGTDKDSNAIFYSKNNIIWLAKNFKLQDRRYSLEVMDVTKPDYSLIKKLSKSKITNIVFEPYMGPPLKRAQYDNRIEGLQKQVRNQLSGFINIIKNTGIKDISLVFVVPSYKGFKGWNKTKINDLIPKRWEKLNDIIGKDLQWSRSNSIIMREIFVFHV